MGRKNAFLETQKKVEDAMYNAGLQVGQQMASDMYDIVLNDPDVMGKDVIGHERIIKIRAAAEDALTYFGPAYDIRNPECDVFKSALTTACAGFGRTYLSPSPRDIRCLRNVVIEIEVNL